MSRPRKIDGYESAKRAEYRGQPHTQLIAVGDNRDALLQAKAKAKENVINQSIIDAFNKSVDLQIEQELRELIHRS